MSQKNKKFAKEERRCLRSNKPLKSVVTTPISSIPREASTKILVDLKAKTGRGLRAALHQSRGSFVAVEGKQTRPVPVKNALKLSKLPLLRLFREQQKAARRAATASAIAQTLTLGGKRRDAYEQAKQNQLAYLKQINAEISHRSK